MLQLTLAVYFPLQDDDPNLTDIEKIKLTQKAAEAEAVAKQAREESQLLKEECENLRLKMQMLNQQVSDFEMWRRLLVDDNPQHKTSSVAQSQGETIVVNREKHSQLKKNFLLLTDKIMKSEQSQKQLFEKLEDRDKQLKELQRKVKDSSVVPRVYESMSSGEGAEQLEELDHDAALREIQNLREVIKEKENSVASLQAQLSSFQRTAAEHSKMEKHGEVQSKAVMEWRRKFEDAEV